ncbi:hypothetical protein MTO96_041397 [Rhipicephalus appendiculatus]
MYQPEPEIPRSVDDDGPRHRVQLQHHYLRLFRRFLSSPLTIGCLVSLVLVHSYCVYSHMANAPAKTVCRRQPAMDNNGTLPDLATTPLHANTISGMFCVAAQYPACPAEGLVPRQTTADSACIKQGDADAFQEGHDVTPEDTTAEPRPLDFPNEDLWTYWNQFTNTPAAGRQPGGFPNDLSWTSGNRFSSFTDTDHRPHDVILDALGFETSRSRLSPVPETPLGLLRSSAVMAPPAFDWFEDFAGCLRYLDESPQASKLLRCFFKTEDLDPGSTARVGALFEKRGDQAVEQQLVVLSSVQVQQAGANAFFPVLRGGTRRHPRGGTEWRWVGGGGLVGRGRPPEW